MAKAEYTYDPSQIMKMFEEFDEKSRKKVFRGTLQKAAGILVRETRKKLKEHIGEAANHKNYWNGKKLSAGVRYKVARNNRMVKVNILNDYRLKFFELGTAQRYNRTRNGYSLKKKANRGSIQPMYFFKDAKASSEQRVFSTINENLAKTIERINKKRYG